MEESVDQLALLKWIAAGLAIPEVSSLNGDASYLFGNMIAKYSLAADAYGISTMALEEFVSIGVDLDGAYARSKFYGKKSAFIYEHPVPASIVRRALLQIEPSEVAVRRILLEAGPVTVLLRSEDERLTNSGLRNSMPKGWNWGDDPYERYKQVGIKISGKLLRLHGKIKR